jgi:hypothetical protein
MSCARIESDREVEVGEVRTVGRGNTEKKREREREQEREI